MPITKLTPENNYPYLQDRLEALEQAVPEAFADGKINWDSLREVLGDNLEDEARDEYFGLNWPGKREARKKAATPSHATLVPAPGEGVNEDTTENLFIEGDNLEVLKMLQKSYAGKIKMIYIDPPYNTGNDFIYNDSFTDPLEAYLDYTGAKGESGELLTTNTRADGRFHSKWLNMMYPRLILARQLLCSDGLIFISIDDNEAHNLQLILEEIFGAENYLISLYIQVRFPTKTLVEDMNYHKMIEKVIIFGKSQGSRLKKEKIEYGFDKFCWRIVENGKPITIELGEKKVDIFQPDQYEIELDTPSMQGLKEIWASGKILDGNSSGRFFRDYLSGRFKDDGLGVLYKVWGIGDDQFPFRYFTGPKREGATKGKYYQGVPNSRLDETNIEKRELPIQNFFNFAENFGNCRHEGNVDFRNGKKPIVFLNKLIDLVDNFEPNDIVLDFFSGSASFAHAVMEHNSVSANQLKYICVQLPEIIDESEFDTIAEIGKERIRRVIQQMESKGSQKSAQISLFQNKKLDLGFKVYKQTRSTFKQWKPLQDDNPESLTPLFDNLSAPLVQGWKKQDLLSEILLLEGFPLTSKITYLEDHLKNEVYRVNMPDFCAHDLFVCLDETIQPATVDLLTMEKEDIFVCLDSALSDELKARLQDQFNVHVI